MHGTLTRRPWSPFILGALLLLTGCVAKFEMALVGDSLDDDRVDVSVIVAEKSQVAELNDPAASPSVLVNSSTKQETYLAFAKYRGERVGMEYAWNPISGPTLRTTNVEISAKGNEISVCVSSKLLERVTDAVVVVVAHYNSEDWKTKTFEALEISEGRDIRVDVTRLLAVE